MQITRPANSAQYGINYKKAFTLAEILTVITIIGIIAMETIPTLVQSTKNATTVVGVRKVQSELSQAYTSFIADGTTMDEVFAGDSQYVTVLNRFITKLNVIKNCGAGAGCFPNTIYTYLNENPWSNLNSLGFGSAILADGSSIMIIDSAGACDNHTVADPSNPLYNRCGKIYVDINGFKSPNQLGRDFFFFYVTRTGIFPYGSNSDTLNCDITGQGTGCASKILTDGAVNY